MAEPGPKMGLNLQQAAAKFDARPAGLGDNTLTPPAAGIIEHPVALTLGLPNLTQSGVIEGAVPAVLGPSDVVARRTSAGSIEVPGPDQGLQYATREDAEDMKRRYDEDPSTAVIIAVLSPAEWQQELQEATRNGGIEGLESALYVKLLNADHSVYEQILRNADLEG